MDAVLKAYVESSDQRQKQSNFICMVDRVLMESWMLILGELT
jgi:hypothetical protein